MKANANPGLYSLQFFFSASGIKPSACALPLEKLTPMIFSFTRMLFYFLDVSYHLYDTHPFIILPSTPHNVLL